MTSAVEFDLSADSSTLFIFFGGMAAGIAMPPFEFYNFSKILGESKIFVRDFDQCWYHAGLPGCSRDIYSTVNYLRGEIRKIGPRRIVFVGNSMGGYAAMLFAALLGEGEVVAFAPQTFISPLLRMRYRDGRWRRQIFKVWWRGLFARKVWDLRPLLSRRGAGLKISVFVSAQDRLDYAHALRIKGVPGVTVHEVDGGGHDVVKLLRDNGSLPAIMAGTYA